MAEFNEVSVTKKANLYFDGNVSSRTLTFKDGSQKTLGVMLPGEYQFGTGEKELMEIYSGELDVLLPGSSEWRTINDGETFEVEGNSKFQVKVKKVTDYCCSFIK